MNELLLVVDFRVEIVEIFDQVGASEWIVWLNKVSVLLLNLGVKLLPLLVKVLSVFFVLLDSVNLLLVGVHLQGFIEGKRIDFLENGLQGDERLLQDLVPMVLSEVNDDWNKHWESFLLVGLEDVQEVVVLKEAHSSVGNLQVNTTNALDDSLEELVDQVFNLVDFANFEDFLQFSQEEGFLDAVGKWPVLQKSFKQWDGEGPVLGQEEHGASEELLIELRTSLYLVQWDDDILEENNVFVPEWNCETTDDAGKDIEQLGCSVEFVSFVDQGEETLVNSLSDHLSSWDKLGVQLVKNVLEVVSFNRFF